MTSFRAVQLARMAGVAGALAYLLLALAAFVFYPQDFDPVRNWLSDLGNSLVNPTGAIFYNSGCIIAGLLLGVLYVRLGQWRNGDKVLGRLLTVGQMSGLISSLALILSALFNIGQNPRLHGRFSMVFTIGLTWFLCFTNTALLRHARFWKALGIFGFAVAATGLAYGVFINQPVAEWVTVALFIVYVIILVANLKRLRPDELQKI
jgi:hypothetical membrane protein